MVTQGYPIVKVEPADQCSPVITICGLKGLDLKNLHLENGDRAVVTVEHK